MTDVTESVDVNVPVNTAYNQWTQFESFPQFMDGVESVRQLDDRHTHWVTEVAGVRREFDAEITEQHPDERIAWKSVSGDTKHAGVVTFHRLNDSQTKVTVQLSWEPEGVKEKVGSALHVDNRQVKADTARFKRFIEQRGTETGAYRGEHPAPRPGGFGV
ncbi:SRPBCC family protein [Actinospica sp. MGRD01-02]|uniref:SRPBCC family protein n=1 Tax=Actinospica acidithermotolerans TaxID=2828514 RepID=A0A941E858_9ACTN|nr:SRPBCC family protein [Actinospica acidithermotolerans]MBR7825577.1 SRPBCC family protein [Actinospica acidithermotolerans]